MESTSKVAVTPEELARLTEKGLGLSLIESREITEGWFNTIHRLVLDDGSVAGLKIAPPLSFEAMTYEKDLLQAEIGVQTLLVNSGILGTQVLAQGTDPIAGESMDWFMYRWVEGSNLDSARKTMDPASQERADAEVGRQGALVNSIVGKRFGRWHVDHCASESWPVSFSKMIEDLLADAERISVDLPWDPIKIRSLLERSGPALSEVTQARLVLWDLHDGNIIVDPVNGEVKAIIDGDRALWGDPLMEFYFRSFVQPSPDWRTAYNNTFDTTGASVDTKSRAAQIRISWYDLYLALVMVIETVYRKYPPGHDQWAKEMGSRALNSLD